MFARLSNGWGLAKASWHVLKLDKELLERIGEAARNAKLDIIINFENLRQATPRAIHALLDGEALKSVAPYAKVRYRNFKAAFEEALKGFSLTGLEMLKEDWQDA